MSNFKNISADEFINTYNSYPPNKWIKFAFKYFSKSTERKNMNLKNWLVYILLGLFSVGMIGTILNWSTFIIGIIIITYSVLLAILVIFLLIAVWMNNRRIKKIAKKLNITLVEYNILANKFL